jgi:hypothetical protein
VMINKTGKIHWHNSGSLLSAVVSVAGQPSLPLPRGGTPDSRPMADRARPTRSIVPFQLRNAREGERGSSRTTVAPSGPNLPPISGAFRYYQPSRSCQPRLPASSLLTSRVRPGEKVGRRDVQFVVASLRGKADKESSVMHALNDGPACPSPRSKTELGKE